MLSGACDKWEGVSALQLAGPFLWKEKYGLNMPSGTFQPAVCQEMLFTSPSGGFVTFAATLSAQIDALFLATADKAVVNAAAKKPTLLFLSGADNTADEDSMVGLSPNCPASATDILPTAVL